MCAIAGGGLHQPVREVLSPALQRASQLNFAAGCFAVHAMAPLLHQAIANSMCISGLAGILGQ